MTREYGPAVLRLVIVFLALAGANSIFIADQPTPERTGTIACETENGVSLVTYTEHEAPQSIQDEIDLCERKLGVFNEVTDAYDFGFRGGPDA